MVWETETFLEYQVKIGTIYAERFEAAQEALIKSERINAVEFEAAQAARGVLQVCQAENKKYE